MKIFSSKEILRPPPILAVEELPDVRIVRFQGPIDITTVDKIRVFQNKIRSAKEFQHKHLLLDFKNVTHIDTAAIAGIIKTTSELKKDHHRLGVINLEEKFHNILEVLKVDEMVFIYPNENEAIKSLLAENPAKA